MSDGLYSSTSQNSPVLVRTKPSVCKPLALYEITVVPSIWYGFSSYTLMLGKPVTGAPAAVKMGKALNISMVFVGETRTCKITGSNSGTAKANVPLMVAFGPRSVTIQNSSAGSPGARHKSLPMPPRFTLRSLMMLPGK